VFVAGDIEVVGRAGGVGRFGGDQDEELDHARMFVQHAGQPHHLA
jgi:hypothetical protein